MNSITWKTSVCLKFDFFGTIMEAKLPWQCLGPWSLITVPVDAPSVCVQQPGKAKLMTAGVIWHRGGSLQWVWPINPNPIITPPLIRKCALISRALEHGVSHQPNYQHLLPGLTKAGTAAGDVIVSLSFWAETAHKNVTKWVLSAALVATWSQKNLCEMSL